MLTAIDDVRPLVVTQGKEVAENALWGLVSGADVSVAPWRPKVVHNGRVSDADSNRSVPAGDDEVRGATRSARLICTPG